MRKTGDRLEIATKLKYCYDSKVKLMAWQPIESEDNITRRIAYCLISNFSAEFGTISLFPFDAKDVLKFDKAKPIYIHSDFDQLLFKELIEYCSDNLIICRLPRDLQLIEKRSDPRKTFNPRDDRRVNFVKISKITEKARGYSQRVFDINKKGLAFGISTGQLGDFKVGSEIHLKKIAGHELEETVAARVLYVAEVRLKARQGLVRAFRVGVLFGDPLSQQVVENIY